MDRHDSTFIYRKYVDGRWQLVQLTSIPPPAELKRALAKAEDSAQIEQARRDALLQGQPVVLIDSATRIDGRYEIGPLLRDGRKTTGIRTGSNALDQIFSKLEELPIADRARLELNHFASTLLDLDANADGTPEKVFLTIEFPPAAGSVPG